MDSPPNNLLEALKQVERRTENSASGWRLLLYAIALVPVAAILPEILWGDHLIPPPPESGPIPSWPGILLGSVCMIAVALLYARWQRAFVRKSLDVSHVAERIAGGELAEDLIFDLTPWPWRLTLPGRGPTPSLADVIRRVAWNLDWYGRSPRRNWRWIWLYEPAAWTLFVYMMGIQLWAWLLPTLNLRNIGGLTAYRYFGIILQDLPSWWRIGWLGTLIALVLLLPLCFLHFRRQIWTEELVRHLRQRLEA